MSNKTRRIVVLSKIDSPRIEQAIFILRDDSRTSETDAVSEAQRIVDNYLKSQIHTPVSAPQKKVKRGFIFAMALYTFATISITAYIVSVMG